MRYGPGVRLIDNDVLAEQVGRAWLALAAHASRAHRECAASFEEDEWNDPSEADLSSPECGTGQAP